MLRTLLAFLLLANYLLVVGAGLGVARAAAPTFSAAHPYEHSQHCQQQNYLRLDCFEQCNGRQQASKAKLPTGAGLHFLAQLKGLDVHCPAAFALLSPRLVIRPLGKPQPAAAAAAMAAGFGSRDYPPPRRG
ncbi:hypothetical protein I2I05_15100 [Hymenobacter sp. BT683]|uniref:Uncharacterized protein n=1 Tax=Hymenobacter jeongseonensis TaxID=2791027 RepID=A0ABS0IK60_9BACT|nr:hypothetical protein [Hymenobacter jeongseonensis]MBF9238731.1 hypothetical protein [Hymenobacter jeongseonensis]